MDDIGRGGFVDLASGDDNTTRKAKKTVDDDISLRLREQFHNFKCMAMPYFRENRNGRNLLAAIVILTLANSAVRVFFSYLARDFWSALQEKDANTFYNIMRKFLGAMILLAPITVAYRYQRQRLAIAWRKWMTGRVLRLYFTNKVYYMLERRCSSSSNDGIPTKSSTYPGANATTSMTNEVDNPDQRISEDIRSFTEFSLTFFLSIITSVIDLVCFSIILFTIMPQLFIAILLFATIGTVLTVVVGKVLIRLNYDALRKEADFRFSLVRVRENSESIAFYAGENVEERETERRFESVITNMSMINVAQRNLEFVTTYYNYLTWILPILVIAPQYFAGNVELGVISQASSAFGHILDDMSLIVNSFTDISQFSAGIARLYSFLNAIAVLDPKRRSMASLLSAPADSEGVIFKEETRISYTTPAPAIRVKEFDPLLGTSPRGSPQSSILSIDRLSVATPDNKRSLIENLNLSLMNGKHLLIVGASGSGKSSLLRAIAGLWDTGAGEIVRPGSEHVYFLPQKPYCPPGTLRDQLLYPSTNFNRDDHYVTIDESEHRPDGGPRPKDERRLHKDWSDDELIAVLRSVDLPDLASRAGDGDPYAGLNTKLDWSNTLSLGEQQRLAFGRLVVNRPRLVIMDESTSALDVPAETAMYKMLKELSSCAESGGGLTYISVGHRPTLLAHHDLKLSLRDGSGFLSEIPSDACTLDEGFVLT
jgi:ABC-type uncharacterized transport system fused permease/ATPase subunit